MTVTLQKGKFGNQRYWFRSGAPPRLNLRVGSVAADSRVGRRADLEYRPAGAPADTFENQPELYRVAWH